MKEVLCAPGDQKCDFDVNEFWLIVFQYNFPEKWMSSVVYRTRQKRSNQLSLVVLTSLLLFTWNRG